MSNDTDHAGEKRTCSKCGETYAWDEAHFYHYERTYYRKDRTSYTRFIWETRCKKCLRSTFDDERAPEGYRRCPCCNEMLEKTEANFGKVVRTEQLVSGEWKTYIRWQGYCKRCQIKKKREGRAKSRQARVQAQVATRPAETRATPTPKPAPTPTAVKAKAAGKPKARAQANEVRELIAWLDRRRIGTADMTLIARLNLLQERDRDLQRAFVGQRAQIVELRRELGKT